MTLDRFNNPRRPTYNNLWSQRVVMLAEAVHPAVIADSDNVTVTELSRRVWVRCVGDDVRFGGLYDKYRDFVRFRKRLNLWFTAPCASVTNRCAVAAELGVRHQASGVHGGKAVFALRRRDEWQEIVLVLVHVGGSGEAGCGVCGAGLWNESKDAELVSDCAEQTVTIWVDLV